MKDIKEITVTYKATKRGKIDFEKNNIIICFPVRILKQTFKDQSPSTIEKCPLCLQEMWITQKKMELRATNPEKIKAYCIVCIRQGMFEQGITLNEGTVRDIQKPLH